MEALAAGRNPDRLRVEEEMLGIFVRLLAAAFRLRPKECGAGRRGGRRELAEAARGLLARRFRESLTLSQLAGALGVSPFHLSRGFREATGSTLHAYRNALRLAAALEEVCDPRRNLTAIALDLGYSSHSHFTAAFRRQFGIAPSQARHLLCT
ncbi:MAG: helix-turn-helix transcriptional regulator [Thermoanaerobaculia bacterium]